MSITVAMRTEISQLYVSLFGRAPDGEGLGFWVSSYSKGNSLANIAQSMYETAPARAYYPLFATSSEIVTTFYTNVLGRAPDAEGLAFWVKEYSAAATPGAFFSKLISNVVNYNGTDAAGLTSKSLFTNKVSVAQYYGELNGSVANATAALSGVTSVASTVDTAKAAILAGGVTTGQTFTLTTSADTSGILVGSAGTTSTAGDDVFSAAGTVETSGGTFSSATFNAGDQIAGGLGNDVINFTIDGVLKSASATAIPTPSVSLVETFNLRAVPTMVSTSTVTANADNLPGLTTFGNDRSTAAIVVTNLPAGSTYNVNGNGIVTHGTQVIGYKTATATPNLTITNGVVGGNISFDATGVTDAATSATISSSGAANTVGTVDLLTGASTLASLTINAATNLTGTIAAEAQGDFTAASTLTVNGAAAKVTLSAALADALTTVNASGLTGGLTATLGTGVTAFTGGAGADVITTAATTAAGAVISGGAGTADTLSIAATNDITTSAKAAQYTNFEIVRANASLNASLFSGISAVEVGASTSTILSGLSAAQAANIKVVGDTATAVTFALGNSAGTADVLSLTLGTGLTTAAATNLATSVVANGFETINIAANPGPTSTLGAARISTVGAITGDKVKTINLTGTSINLANAATTLSTTINASALTGDGTASGSIGLVLGGTLVGGSVVTGSAFNDTLTAGGENATYTAAAGNDKFITTQELATADGATDMVVDGGVGTDTLQLTTFSAVGDTAFTNFTGFEKLVLDATSTATTTVVATLGSAARTAFPTGVTVTSGATADATLYTFASGLYDKAVTLTLVSAATGASAAANITITTGSGNDIINVSAPAWVAGATAGPGVIAVSTGAGNDTITVATGTQTAATAAPVVITPGLGADVVYSTGVNITSTANALMTTYVVPAGDSLITGYDQIHGFDLGNGTLSPNVLALEGTPRITAYSATAATGYTGGELTVTVTTTTGLVVFAGTSAASLTLANKILAVQSVVTATALDTAIFLDGNSTFVFQNNTAGDTLIELVGVTGASLASTNAVTAGNIMIT
jgi:hypothetical protein